MLNRLPSLSLVVPNKIWDVFNDEVTRLTGSKDVDQIVD